MAESLPIFLDVLGDGQILIMWSAAKVQKLIGNDKQQSKLPTWPSMAIFGCDYLCLNVSLIFVVFSNFDVSSFPSNCRDSGRTLADRLLGKKSRDHTSFRPRQSKDCPEAKTAKKFCREECVHFQLSREPRSWNVASKRRVPSPVPSPDGVQLNQINQKNQVLSCILETERPSV